MNPPAAPALRRSLVFVAAALAAAFVATSTPRADEAPLSGQDVLARAGRADGLTSYSVPVHFAAHMRRPVGAHAQVEAIAYFKSPAQSALVITKAPPPIGNFFKGSYAIDMVPQAWATKYKVSALSTETANGSSVYVLNALPVPAGPIDSVIFRIAQADFAPLSVKWIYHDHSSIDLSFVNQHVDTWLLPATATINVNMPTYAIDADATYGTYAANAAIPDGVFSKK